MNKFDEKLSAIQRKFEEISAMLLEPGISSDPDKYVELMKSHNELLPIVKEYEEYRGALKAVEDCLFMLEEENDKEMRELLKDESLKEKEKLSLSERKLKILLLPTDPDDSKSVIVEIRAGVGGEEAALFAANLYRMYCKYAEKMNWKVETTDYDDTGIGGLKTVSFIIEGMDVYKRMKYESGVHRVQRVPETESGGRIHTSTATVAIMPEAKEVEVDINMNDCRFDVFRSSGHGGQSVNTTDSAVRLTHYPTGIVISCQDEKSQLKNKDKALKILRAMLYVMEKEKIHSTEADLRRSQIGSGDRSEKIRTYNFPQGRVTDHRIKLTLYKIDQIIDGELDELIDSLISEDQAVKLAKMED